MHGNVWEWCSDRWHKNYNYAPTDGSSWETGTENQRVLRGGSFRYNARSCSASNRFRYDADYRAVDLSFRVACSSFLPRTP